MTERVQCGECAHLYDSDEHPFCPRCGALDKAKDPGRAVASAGDVRRRPVQAAGVMLVTLGALSMALFIATAILAPQLVPQTMEAVSDLDGGSLQLTVLDANGTVEGAFVVVSSVNGTMLLNGTTNSDGVLAFEHVSHAGVNVSVTTDAGTWDRRVLTLAEGEGTRFTLNLDEDPQQMEAWVGTDEVVQVSRVLAGFFALAASVTLIGGISAMRLRGRQWALAGAVVGILPSLLLAMVNWVFFLFPILFGFALWTFVKNRTIFA